MDRASSLAVECVLYRMCYRNICIALLPSFSLLLRKCDEVCRSPLLCLGASVSASVSVPEYVKIPEYMLRRWCGVY